MALEPAPVVNLGGVGADQEQALRAQAAQGEVPDQLAALIQHRRKRDPAGFRHVVRHDVRQPLFGARTGDLEFSVVGDLEQPDRLAHRAAFDPDVRVRVRAMEGDRFACFGRARGKPQRVLEPAVVAEHRVLALQVLVDRRGAQRPPRRQLLVREADAKASRVVLAHLGVGVGERRPVAVARDVHRPHVRPRVPVHHPVRERESDAAPLAEPGHHAAGDPEVPQPPHRSD